MHVCWQLSEALFRLRAPPSGSLCEWLWKEEEFPLHTVIDDLYYYNAPEDDARGRTPDEGRCGEQDEGPASASGCQDTYTVQIHGLPPHSCAKTDHETPIQSDVECKYLAMGSNPVALAVKTEEPSTVSDAISMPLFRWDLNVSLCRYAVSCSSANKTSLPLQSSSLYQHPEARGSLSHSCPEAPHCCPSSPETAAGAYQRYSNAIDYLAGLFPGEDILLVTHGGLFQLAT